MRRNTVFLDMDGTLVYHNYTPFTKDDILLPGTVELLKSIMNTNSYCILTTGRSEPECIGILKRFKNDFGFEFDRCLYNLPTGIRILINDTKDLTIPKAIAHSLKRDEGPLNIQLL